MVKTTRKTTKKLLAIIALAAVIGFGVTACKKGDDGGGSFNGYRLKGGAPSSATLANYGLTESDLNGVFSAARAVNTDDADYQGWYEIKETEDGVTLGFLCFVWYNKTQAKYQAMCDSLGAKFGPWSTDTSGVPMPLPGGGTVLAELGFDSSNNICCVEFWIDGYEDVPKNTLALVTMYIK